MGLAKLNQANSSPLINYVSTWSIMYQYSLKLLKADHAVLWALMGSDQEIYVWRAWRLDIYLFLILIWGKWFHNFKKNHKNI